MENFPCKRGQLGSEADIFFLLVSACFAFNLIKYTVQSSLRALKSVFILCTLWTRLPPSTADEYEVSEERGLNISVLSDMACESGSPAWCVGRSCRQGLALPFNPENSHFYLFLRPAVMLLPGCPCIVGITAGVGMSAAGQEKALLGSLMGFSVLCSDMGSGQLYMPWEFAKHPVSWCVLTETASTSFLFPVWYPAPLYILPNFPCQEGREGG